MSSNVFAANVYYAGNVIVSQTLNVGAITSTAAATFSATPAAAANVLTVIGSSTTGNVVQFSNSAGGNFIMTNAGRIGIGTTNPVQALEVSGSAVVAGTLSAGNPLMFRNALYNGDMRINQRGAGYILDRWPVSNYGAGGAYFTISQIQSGLANFSNALQLQQTSTNSMFFFLQQSLETRDVVRFQGQPVTVSFWYRIPVSFSGSLSAQLNWSTAVDTSLRDIGVSYTTAASITLTNTTAWTYASFTTFVPLAAQALSVMFTNYPPGGSTVNGAQFQVTGVQLEKGTVATPFEVRPFATELALCQRYFLCLGDGTGNGDFGIGCVYANTTTTSVSCYFNAPVTMRIAPSSFSVGAGALQLYNGPVGYTVTSLSVNAENTAQVPAYYAVAATTAPVLGTFWKIIGQGAAKMFISAEL